MSRRALSKGYKRHRQVWTQNRDEHGALPYFAAEGASRADRVLLTPLDSLLRSTCNAVWPQRALISYDARMGPHPATAAGTLNTFLVAYIPTCCSVYCLSTLLHTLRPTPTLLIWPHRPWIAKYEGKERRFMITPTAFIYSPDALLHTLRPTPTLLIWPHRPCLNWRSPGPGVFCCQPPTPSA